MSLFFLCLLSSSFFFNDTSTTEIYTLSLHDALPICSLRGWCGRTLGLLRQQLGGRNRRQTGEQQNTQEQGLHVRSEEHTSELQSHSDLVCRLLLEKKKQTQTLDTACK